jgi:hypothetical protein
MSPREKRLLIFFAIAGFVVLNFLGVGFYNDQKTKITRDRDNARLKLETAQQFRTNREQVSAEMEWLAAHEPAEAAKQDAQTQLQQLCEKEAKTLGLSIKSQKPLPTDEQDGLRYHRAKIEITVNGTEEALYRWFDRLNIPEQMRIATRIRILPNTQDDTKIDCTATIEQWFTPLPPSA